LLEKLLHWDQELFFAINGANNSFFDFLMFWISNKYIWIPLYAFFVFLFFKNFKWKAALILVFSALLITMSDQISVHFFKEVFQRIRPCHDPAISEMVHLVNGHCGGKYSLVSSHATNLFALALFLINIFGNKYKYFTLLILFWAGIGSYSRVYLGVHYPLDVIAGAIVGSILGIIIGRLCLVFLKGMNHPERMDSEK